MHVATRISKTCVLTKFVGDLGTCRWCATALPRLKSGAINKKRYWCSSKCGDLFWQNHSWSQARIVARRRDRYKCRVCGARGVIEVDHIVPMRGVRHSTNGCYHHLDNLRVLCHYHHQQVTRKQKMARLLGESDVIAI